MSLKCVSMETLSSVLFQSGSVKIRTSGIWFEAQRWILNLIEFGENSGLRRLCSHFLQRKDLFTPIVKRLWIDYNLCKNKLRVVQTRVILFLKSLSEKVGSHIERLWNWMMNFFIDSKSIEDVVIQIKTRSMSDSTLSNSDFKNKIAWVWTTPKMK